MARVALCITGQMRNVEWTVRQLHWAVEHVEATVIFSVWDRIGRKVDGALNLYQLARMFDRAAFTAIPTAWHGYNVLWRKLPLLHEKLLDDEGDSDEARLREVIGRYLPQAVVDIESGALLDLEFPQERQDKNSVRMTYKMWRASQIRRRIERASGQPFDVVIRVRPDLNFVNLRIEEIASRVLGGEFLVNNWLGHWVGDNFCAGRPAEVDAYASIFGRTILTPLQWEFIHTDLARHLVANGLNVARYTGLEDPLDDDKVPSTDLTTALERQRSTNGAWSDEHAAVLAAARAGLRLDSAQSDAAVAELARFAESATPEQIQVDGFLYTLGRALLDTGSPNAAAACFTAARFWERESVDPRRRMAVAAVAEAMAAHVEPAAPFRAETLAAAFASDFGPGWVADALVKGRAETTIQNRLESLLNEAFAQPEAITVLTEEFARSGRADLAFAALDQIAGSPEVADHGQLGQHIVVTSINALQPGADVEAAPALRRAVELTRANIYFGYDLANTLKEEGRFAEARVLQGATLEMDPDHAGANRQMAEICLQLEDYEAARDHAAKAVSLDAQEPHRMLLAFADFKRGDMDRAQAEWEALTRAPTALPAFFTLPGFEAFLNSGVRAAEVLDQAPAQAAEATA